jgi:hypothetical protein
MEGLVYYYYKLLAIHSG